MGKHISIYSFFFFSFFLNIQVFGQDIDLSGNWEGTITQFEGGYRSEYTFDLTLRHKGDKVYGRSYVYVDDIYLIMEVEGSVFSGGLIISLSDTKVVKEKKMDGMEWCNKTYYLVHKLEGNIRRLDGSWRGRTSFATCIPGKIHLKKVTPRA